MKGCFRDPKTLQTIDARHLCRCGTYASRNPGGPHPEPDYMIESTPDELLM